MTLILAISWLASGACLAAAWICFTLAISNKFWSLNLCVARKGSWVGLACSNYSVLIRLVINSAGYTRGSAPPTWSVSPPTKCPTVTETRRSCNYRPPAPVRSTMRGVHLARTSRRRRATVPARKKRSPCWNTSGSRKRLWVSSVRDPTARRTLYAVLQCTPR